MSVTEVGGSVLSQSKAPGILKMPLASSAAWHLRVWGQELHLHALVVKGWCRRTAFKIDVDSPFFCQ